MRAVRIYPVVKEYNWGNFTTIPRLLGKDPDGNPKAELWFGTHPAGIACAEDQPFDEYLAQYAESTLGGNFVAKFGNNLPFLLKILAIDKPLSIQCHPNKKQAEEGYRSELPSHATLPYEAWNYKDANQKAEVLLALNEVTALCGFRNRAEIETHLGALMPISWNTYFSHLPESNWLKHFFTCLYTLSPDALAHCIREYLCAVEQLPDHEGPFLSEKEIVLSSQQDYPNDPGLFAPFFLNLVHLEPNMALYLAPGILHAYIKGEGLELMSNSDNVLRAGLTHKKVDVDALLNILSAEWQKPVMCSQSVQNDGRVRILTPADEFLLEMLPTGSYSYDCQGKPELLLCVTGSAILRFPDIGEVMVLKTGECVFMPVSLKHYSIEVTGNVCSASVSN